MSERDNNGVEVVGDFVLAVFRLNGSLIEAGNRLVMDVGLTSAWWQVLGALDLSPVPLPVAHIARNMGLARQSVQRIVDLLADKGLVRFEANPHHRRAKLVVLTDEGRAAARAAGAKQQPWARALAAALDPERVAAALEVLTRMDALLTSSASAEDDQVERKEVEV